MVGELLAENQLGGGRDVLGSRGELDLEAGRLQGGEREGGQYAVPACGGLVEGRCHLVFIVFPLLASHLLYVAP